MICYLKQFDGNTITIMILSSPLPTNNGRLWQVGKIQMKINFENQRPDAVIMQIHSGSRNEHNHSHKAMH